MHIWEVKFVLSLPYIGKWARKKREKWVFEDDPNNKRPVIGIALSSIAFMYVWADTPLKKQLSERDFARFLEYNKIREDELPANLR
ncbi:MAG: hypothetical protein QXN59_00010 [Candidatus Micrarchaeaceae archaeon]